jgi:hypothetical protein
LKIEDLWMSLCATSNEFPRRKRRGINRRILIAPRGGKLNPRPRIKYSTENIQLFYDGERTQLDAFAQKAHF